MEQEVWVQLAALGFAAHDPAALAPWWAAALRWKVGDRGSDGAVDLVPTDGTPFPIRFRPTTSPRTGPGRIHLDLTTSSLEDQQDTVARLIELGGRHLDIGQGPDARHVVLADPEGNELCIIEPTNNFLAGCGRLGALSCDGTEQVGRFWSVALGWPLIWDQDEETAIRAPDAPGPIISWGGPPVAPKVGRNRLHLDLVPASGVDQQAAVDHLLALGAARAEPTGGDPHGPVGAVPMTDPDANEFCVLAP
ncbi:VOC family protein [soil metagenome]